MNEARISAAAGQIAKRRTALLWLEQYGVNLTGRSDSDSASVSVHLNYASACPGAKEAAEVLSSYGRVHLPEIVKSAIECCRNDIAMAIDAIREEVGEPDGAVTQDKRGTP